MTRTLLEVGIEIIALLIKPLEGSKVGRRNRIQRSVQWDISLSSQDSYLNSTKELSCAISVGKPKAPKMVSGIAISACTIPAATVIL